MAGIVNSSETPFFTESRIQRLKAVGYGSLAVITGVALWTLSAALCFYPVGFAVRECYLLYYGHLDWSLLAPFLATTLLGMIVLGSLISIYPIKYIAGSLLDQASHHWELANQKTLQAQQI